MVVFNYSGEEINAKIVYYGPALSGKTTNLEYIHSKMPSKVKGKLVSMKTRTDRTLFFDFLPLELGEISGYRTRFMLYTVPGQVYYNATRKLVLKGADAVVFVADSTPDKMEENLESLRNLEENLNEYGMSLDSIPWVMQYNKRDVKGAVPRKELDKKLNLLEVPSFEAVATKGPGIYETFQGIAGLLYRHLKVRLEKEKSFGKDAPRPVAETGPGGRRLTITEEPERGGGDSVTDVVDVALREIDDGEVPGSSPKRDREDTLGGGPGPREPAPKRVDSPRGPIPADPRDPDFVADEETLSQEPRDAEEESTPGGDYPLESLGEDDIDSNVGRVINFDEAAATESDEPDEPDSRDFITSPERPPKPKASPSQKDRPAETKRAADPVETAPPKRAPSNDAPTFSTPAVKPPPKATRTKPSPPKPAPPQEQEAPKETRSRWFPWQRAVAQKEAPEERRPPEPSPPKSSSKEPDRADLPEVKESARDFKGDLEEEYTVTIPIFISRTKRPVSIPIKIILDVREDD